MPSGTKVQVEDWSSDYPGLHGVEDVLAAYPEVIGQHGMSSFERKLFEIDRPMRVTFQFEDSMACKAAYEKLVGGDATLADFEDCVAASSRGHLGNVKIG